MLLWAVNHSALPSSFIPVVDENSVIYIIWVMLKFFHCQLIVSKLNIILVSIEVS